MFFSGVIRRSVGLKRSLLALLLSVSIMSCEDRSKLKDTPEVGLNSASIAFTEIAKESGIDFVHYNGMTGKLRMPEILGSGAAFLDFDLDGDLDLYLVQGNRIDQEVPFSNSIFIPEDTLNLRDQLYRNELVETGQLNFTNVTDESGIRSTGYGMGVIVGNLNNDKYPDLVVTNLGSNTVLINDGRGRFKPATISDPAGKRMWSGAASILDINGDGYSDIYIGNYVDYFGNPDKECKDQSGRLDYCGPLTLGAQEDQVYINQSGTAFTFYESWIPSVWSPGATLGSATLSLEGSLGIYLANDAYENHLLRVAGDTFENLASLRGVSVNGFGKKEGSMGIALGDYNNDLNEDIFVTHWKEETNTLYRNEGSNNYFDQTSIEKLALPSRNSTGFGARWLDLDGQEGLDLYVVNGSIRKLSSDHPDDHPFPLTEFNQVFLAGTSGFVENQDNQLVKSKKVSRALLSGDLDNDGDLELLVTNNSDSPELFLNESESTKWIGFDIVDGKGIRHDFHEIIIRLKSGDEILRVGRRDGSYFASSDPRSLFRLKADDEIASAVCVVGASRKTIDIQKLKMDTYNLIEV